MRLNIILFRNISRGPKRKDVTELWLNFALKIVGVELVDLRHFHSNLGATFFARLVIENLEMVTLNFALKL